MANCSKCGIELIPEINWYKSHRKKSYYICKECWLRKQRIPKVPIICKNCGKRFMGTKRESYCSKDCSEIGLRKLGRKASKAYRKRWLDFQRKLGRAKAHSIRHGLRYPSSGDETWKTGKRKVARDSKGRFITHLEIETDEKS